MRKDLIVGILLSLALHGGLLWGDRMIKRGPPPPPPPKEEEKILQMTPPPPPDEDPEEVQELTDEAPAQMAPPSLVDIPTVVPVNAFTQPLQPPPPPGLDAAKGALNIPVVKPGTKFGAGMKDLFNVGDLDQPPQLRVPVQPQYPFEMRRAGISGEVVVEFIVDTNGNVVATQIVRSSQREFEQPAMQAVAKWKFKPGRKGGRTVNVRVQQLIAFNLNDEN